MSPGATPLESVLRRDRAVVMSGLVAVVAVAWVYLGDMALGMGEMSGAIGAAMGTMTSWSVVDFVLMLVMWAVMMVGMMVPGATPMILLYAMVNRKSRERGGPFVPTSVFALGYVLVWTAFSVVATIAQWQLHEYALSSPLMVSTGAVVGGMLFIAAGIYQWTPWKHACLRHCRTPLDFLAHRWRTGAGGALRMGLEHGAYCAGCCWFLMGLLFVVGVMNLLWVAAIALFVMGEKLVPRGNQLANAGGGVMVVVGVYLLHRGALG